MWTASLCYNPHIYYSSSGKKGRSVVALQSSQFLSSLHYSILVGAELRIFCIPGKNGEKAKSKNVRKYIWRKTIMWRARDDAFLFFLLFSFLSVSKIACTRAAQKHSMIIPSFQRETKSRFPRVFFTFLNPDRYASFCLSFSNNAKVCRYKETSSSFTGVLYSRDYSFIRQLNFSFFHR